MLFFHLISSHSSSSLVSLMEDLNQTLIHPPSVNATATHDVKDSRIDELLQIPAEIGELDSQDSGDDGKTEPYMHQWLCQYDHTDTDNDTAINHLVDTEDDGVQDDNPTDSDDIGYQIIGEQFASPPVLSRPDRSRLYRQPPPPPNPNDRLVWTTLQTFTCIALLLTLWTVVFMRMIFGAKEIGMMRIGMGYSLLLEPNRFFVETIKMEQPPDTNMGPTLNGFKYRPPLDVVSSWSDAHNVSLQPNIHKEWVYFLNKGSHINISYNVPRSSRLLLMIDRGQYGYGEWIYDRSSPNTTLAWSIIHGNGLIQQNVLLSDRYHISMGNLNSWEEEVQLNISGRALIYDTSNAYYQCNGSCVFPLSFLEANYAILTTPQLEQETCEGNCEWHVKLGYGPRFSTYFGGIFLIHGLMVLGIHPVLKRIWA